MTSPDARRATTTSVRCRGCGADIPVNALTGEVMCVHCGQHQRLDPELLNELDTYQAQVDYRMAQAEQELQNAQDLTRFDDWGEEPEVSAGRKLTVVLVGLGLASLPLLASVAYGLGFISAESAPWVLIALIVALIVGLFVFIAVYYGGRSAPEASLEAEPEAAVKCSSCGAPNELVAGQVLERCAYCGAAMMPSAAVMDAGLVAVDEVHRQAQMVHFRAERSAVVATASNASTTAYMLFIAGLLPAMLMSFLFWIGFDMLLGNQPFHPGVAVGLAAFVVVIVGVIWGIRYGQKRKERWRQNIGELTTAVHGSSIWTMSGVIDWLNTYWAGPYDTMFLMAGPLAAGITTTIQGYPALLFLDPKQPDKWHPPKTHLFLAAWIPGVSDGGDQEPPRTDEVDRYEQGLRSQGFAVELNQGGLLGLADDDLVAMIREQPESMLELAGALVTLAGLGHGLGAAPVPPLS